MREDRDIKDVQEFLNDIGKQYTPEHPEEKTGIGHEVEHLKGVIHRSSEIADIVNGDPVKYQDNKIDKSVSTAIAALHDIGNTVNREFHADVGFGVVQGSLTLTDALNSPSADISAEDMENIVAASNGEIAYSDLSGDEKEKYASAVEKMIVFDIGYNGADLQNYDVGSPVMADALNMIYDGGIADDLHYNPDLKGITEQIHELYTDDEIKTMAEAIQDHNTDYAGGKRFESRSVYGMLIADADRDDIIQTFMIRALAYAENKCPILYESFRKEDGTPDHEKCLSNILIQAWERYREPLDADEAKYQKIPEAALNTYDIKNIKGILTEERAIEYVRSHPDSALNIHEGTLYCIRQEAGDDAYSQIDHKFEPDAPIGAILSLRSDFLKDAALLAQAAESSDVEIPERMSLETIAKIYEAAPSIEAAVDVFETAYRGGGGNRWEEVIEKSLEINKESEPVDAKEKDLSEECMDIYGIISSWLEQDSESDEETDDMEDETDDMESEWYYDSID